MTIPALRQKQAKLIYNLYLNGHLTFDEYTEWLDQLRQPNTFLGWIGWRFFGI